MARFEDQQFVNMNVELDGNEYVRCSFKNCVFIYRGGSPVVLRDYTIKGSRLEFVGPAANTAAMIQDLRDTPLAADLYRLLGLPNHR